MSTSSNDCQYDPLLYGGGGAWANEMGYSWYPSYGQPFTYFSHVEPYRCWQRIKETEKKKPNYFKKAFQWYTQERGQYRNGRTDSSINMNNAHLKGFAAWLDEKYEEFLQTRQIEQSKFILTHTSTVELDKTTYYEQSEQPDAKKYKRMKRPWKKRSKYLNDKGDVIRKSNQSIKVILKPKDISYRVSDCCQRAKAQICCNRSDSAVECNTSALHRVAKARSRSLSSIVKEKEMSIFPFDIPDYDAKIEIRNYEKTRNRDDIKAYTKWNENKYRPRNVSCQCSKYMREKVDAFCQFEHEKRNRQESCICNSNSTEGKLLPNTRNINAPPLFGQDNHHPSKTTSEYFRQKEDEICAGTSTDIQKTATSVLATVNDSIQTSDYSINLNHNMYPGYPLLMKLICANKLNENCKY